MKSILATLLFIFFLFSEGFGQGATLEIEVMKVHCGVYEDTFLGPVDLTGYSTYRLYAVLPEATDCLTGIFGGLNDDVEVECANSDDEDQLTIDFEGLVFNHDFGAVRGTEYLCDLEDENGTMQYDSWVTVGNDCNTQGGLLFNIDICPGDNLGLSFGNTNPTPGAYFEGTDLLIDNGGWFAPNGTIASATAGEDLKVLVAQFTTNAGFEFNGWIGYQAGCTPGTSVTTVHIIQSQVAIPLELQIETALETDVCSAQAQVNLDSNTPSEVNYQLINSDTEEVVAQATVMGSHTFNQMPNGDYYIIAEQVDGCGEAVVSEPFSVDVPPVFELLSQVTTAQLCASVNDAEIHNQTTGGEGIPTLNLTNLDDGSVIEQTGLAPFSELGCGQYHIVAVDGNNCISESDLVIECPVQIEFENLQTADATCYGECDGAISVQVLGGTGPVSFVLDSEEVAQGATPLTIDMESICADNHAWQVIDSNGCAINGIFEIEEPTMLLVDVLEIVQESSDNANDGSIEIEATGGTPPYSVLWNNGAQGPMIDGLSEGDYSAIVTDAHGCQVELEFTMVVTIGEHHGAAVTLYPNPTSGWITLTYGTTPSSITIRDATGRVVSIHSNELKTQQHLLDLSDMTQGFYSFELIFSDGSTVTLGAVKN